MFKAVFLKLRLKKKLKKRETETKLYWRLTENSICTKFFLSIISVNPGSSLSWRGYLHFADEETEVWRAGETWPWMEPPAGGRAEAWTQVSLTPEAAVL